MTCFNILLCGWALYVQFGVGADRVAAAKRVLRSAHASSTDQQTIFILDDGLQYRKLHRDLEVITPHV